MTKVRFFRSLALFFIALVFVKIYQHNQIIKLNYEKQRVENKRNKLKRERNELLVQLSALNDLGKVRKVAQEKMGMQWLTMSQIITVTEQPLFDFYTTTTVNVLRG